MLVLALGLGLKLLLLIFTVPIGLTQWEELPHGGCWTATVPKGPNSKSQLDVWWLNSVRGLNL